ncbi:hypothetical protein O3M35_005232 [Rhynocoris fuscipes]|uniref:Uncharacterized protein n=1 Tax=Rhynocoris fuscipes TaxID=488301 RepID=A0AAW1DPP9_9HEMI
MHQIWLTPCTSLYRFMRANEAQWDDAFKCLNKACQTQITIKGNCIDFMKEKNTFHAPHIEIPYSRDPRRAEFDYEKFSYSEEQDQQNGEEAISQFLAVDRSLQTQGKEYRPPHRTSSSNYTPTPVNRQVGTVKPPLMERREYGGQAEDNRGATDFRKNLRPTNYNRRNDPIMELEMKGREIARNNSQNEDDPPYNFQAMLRKTRYVDYENESSYKRQSFKRRSSIKENTYPYGGDSRQNIINNNVNSNYPADKKKSFNRKNSLENLKMMMHTSHDFKSQSPIFENGNYHDGDIITAELAPGLIITGKVADL